MLKQNLPHSTCDALAWMEEIRENSQIAKLKAWSVHHYIPLSNNGSRSCTIGFTDAKTRTHLTRMKSSLRCCDARLVLSQQIRKSHEIGVTSLELEKVAQIRETLSCFTERKSLVESARSNWENRNNAPPPACRFSDCISKSHHGWVLRSDEIQGGH